MVRRCARNDRMVSSGLRARANIVCTWFRPVSGLTFMGRVVPNVTQSVILYCFQIWRMWVAREKIHDEEASGRTEVN